MMSIGSGGRELVGLSPAGSSFSAMVMEKARRRETWLGRCYGRKEENWKKVYKSELCWILFRQVPPWLRKEKKQFARWLNETLVKSISVSRRYITLLHNYMLKRLKNESFNLLLSVKNSSSCMVPLIPFITFLRRCWGRINDFVLTVNMAALLCTPLQRGYGCSEAMNSCWSTTFYAAIKMGSGNKWTKRSLEIHSYAVTTRMEETCMTAISCLISLNF